MAKITINPITSGNNLENSINLRLQQIEDTFNDDVLWRAGFASEANQMEVDLDMNSNDILNLLELTLGTLPVKSSIETNITDIEQLKDAVNLLWPDKANLPFPGTSLNLRWGQINGNIADQADLWGYLTTHAAGIADNVTDIATNVSDIAALDVRVTQNEADILSNDGDITALDGRVTTNEGDITALDGRVTTNEGDITALDGRVTTNEGDITTLEAADVTLQSNIDAEETARIAADAAVAAKAEDDAIAFAIALGG